jgi:hypothetical protein
VSLDIKRSEVELGYNVILKATKYVCMCLYVGRL